MLDKTQESGAGPREELGIGTRREEADAGQTEHPVALEAVFLEIPLGEPRQRPVDCQNRRNGQERAGSDSDIGCVELAEAKDREISARLNDAILTLRGSRHGGEDESRYREA